MKISNVQAFPIEFPLDVPAHDATGVRSSWNTVRRHFLQSQWLFPVSCEGEFVAALKYILHKLKIARFIINHKDVTSCLFSPYLHVNIAIFTQVDQFFFSPSKSNRSRRFTVKVSLSCKR